MPSKKQVTFASIAELFHLPIVEVAGILGVCTTVLKKVCRRNGIRRWPQRKLQSLNKRIDMLEDSLTTETEVERSQLCSELGCLKKCRLSLTTPLASLDAPVRDLAKQQKAAELVMACEVTNRQLLSSTPPGGTVMLAHAGCAKRPRDACDHLGEVSAATTQTELMTLGAGHHLAANVLPPYEAADGGVPSRMVEDLAPIKSEGAMHPRGLFQNHPDLGAYGRVAHGLHPLAQATLDASTTLCGDKQQPVEIDDARNPALALLELCGRGTPADTEAAADPASAADHGGSHLAARSSVSASACGAQLAVGLTYAAALPPTACMHMPAGPQQVVQAHPMVQAHQAAFGRHGLVHTTAPTSMPPTTTQAYWNAVPMSAMNENTNYWSPGACMSHVQAADASSIWPAHQGQYSVCTSTAPLASIRAAPTPVIQVSVQASRGVRTGTGPVLGMSNMLKPQYEEMKPQVAVRPSGLLPTHAVGQLKHEGVASQISATTWGEQAVTLLTLHPVEGRIPNRYSSPSDICTVDLMAPRTASLSPPLVS